MKGLFATLPQNFLACFRPLMLWWHAGAIGITLICVYSGFDWWYYRAAQQGMWPTLLFPAIVIGGIVPILIPLALLIAGKFFKHWRTLGWALGQAAMLGSAISSLYKAFTGRIQPALALEGQQFQFGFLRHGIFWGWPSSHTTIAFAMAVTLWHMHPRLWVRYVFIVYALYIGLGVSVSIHWFSDFIAGAIIGSIIGVVVGKSFRQKKV
jgi:membrane-associated phospholipid phosphatase